MRQKVWRTIAILGLVLWGWLLPPQVGTAEAQIAFRAAASAGAVPSTITFRAAASAGAASGNLSIAMPAGTVQNDVMIAVIGIRPNTATITTPAGWTLVGTRLDNANATANSLAVYRKVAGAGESGPYLFTLGTNTGNAGGILTFSGVDTTTPIDVTNGASTTVGAYTLATPSVTTTVANTMLVTSYSISNGDLWQNPPPSGMTQGFQQVGGNEMTQANFALQAAAGATGTKSATDLGPQTADQGNAHILALRPAPSTSLTINRPAGTVQGDVMIASIAFRPNCCSYVPTDIGITAPAGWTLVRRLDSVNQTQNGLVVYWKVAGASEPASYNWSFSCTGTCATLGFQAAAGGIVSFSGVDNTTPINVENGDNTSNLSYNILTPSVTTTVANTMLVASYGIANADTWQNPPPSGMTQAFQQTTGAEMIQVSYALQAAAGSTGQKQATDLGPDGADAGNAHILALGPPQCAAVADTSYVSANAQNGQAIVYWSGSNPAVVLRKTAAFAGEAPANGVSYTAGNTIGSATVVYDGAAGVAGMTCAGTSCTNTGLTNGSTYYYKVFAKASASACYAPGTVNTSPGVVARPATGAGAPTWSYTLAGGSILKGGTASGSGTLYTTSNASRIVSISTSDGTQSWDPVATNAPVQAWLTWLPVGGFKYREPLTVTAGTAAVPSGYSVPVTFNHASLVTAGKSRSDGNDVRVLYWNGSLWVQLDRVLDSGSAWNTSSTKIWFKTQAAIGASASDTNYYLYYGNLGATSPPANKANVFLFADDFEAGNLSQWTIVGGLWQIATDRTHSGTYSLKYPAEAAVNQWILANPALNEANVYVDAWWNFSVLDPVNGVPDIAQVFRANASANGYETNLEGQSATREGWDMAKFISGTWTWLNTDTMSTAAANTWTRIGIAISGTGMRIFKDGVQVNPATGSFNVGTELTSGNVGFRKYNTGTGAWWIDDAAARRYVDPEPTTALGAEQASADASVIGVDQGTGAANTGRVYLVDPLTGGANWQVTLTADAFQAGPAAQMLAYANATFKSFFTEDVLFVATYNTQGTFTINNKVFAVGATTGTVLWTFSPGNMDGIAGMPYVDYGRNRLYVTSRAGTGGGQPSVWVINTLNGALITSFQLSHFDSAPTLSFSGNTLYVGAADGDLYAIDVTPATPVLKWSSPVLVGTPVTGFVWEDNGTNGRLYFAAADGTVRCIQDNGTSGAACSGWTNPSVFVASTPLVLGSKLFVGSWNSAGASGQKGKIYQINLTTGAVDKTVVVGDGEKQPGDVTSETGTEIFVGTSEGVIYKFPLTGGSL